jgi:hypothetical protein
MMDHQRSSHLELGSLQKTYRNRGIWIAFFVFMLIMISLSLLVLPGSLDTIWVTIPILFIFILLLVRLWYLKGIPVRISVYEGGLVHQDRHETKVILWSDIRYIRHKGRITGLGSNSPSTQHRYVFQGRDRETLLTLEFDGTWEWRKRRIVEMIEQATSAILYPPALEAYQQNKDCLFGDVTLSRWGVSYGGKMLPWNEVKVFAIGLETICIKRPGDGLLKWWLNAPSETVDNVEVMRKLVEVAASTHHFNIQNYPKYKTRRATEEE